MSDAAYLVSALVEKPGKTGHRAQVGVFTSKEEAIGSSLDLWQTDGWSVSSYDCKLCDTAVPKPSPSSNEEGFVLVPKEPTHEQKYQGNRAVDEKLLGSVDVAAIYRAMVGARIYIPPAEEASDV